MFPYINIARINLQDSIIGDIFYVPNICRKSDYIEKYKSYNTFKVTYVCVPYVMCSGYNMTFFLFYFSLHKESTISKESSTQSTVTHTNKSESEKIINSETVTDGTPEQVR